MQVVVAVALVLRGVPSGSQVFGDRTSYFVVNIGYWKLVQDVVKGVHRLLCDRKLAGGKECYPRAEHQREAPNGSRNADTATASGRPTPAAGRILSGFGRGGPLLRATLRRTAAVQAPPSEGQSGTSTGASTGIPQLVPAISRPETRSTR